MLQTNPSMPLIPSAVLFPFHLQNHSRIRTAIGTCTFLCTHQRMNVFWAILAMLLPNPGRHVGYRHEELRVNQDLSFSSPSMLCFQLSLAHTTHLSYLAQAPPLLWEMQLRVQCGLQSLPEKQALEWAGLCWISHCPFPDFKSSPDTSLLLLFWSFAYNCHWPPTWISTSNWHKHMCSMNVMLSPFFCRC